MGRLGNLRTLSLLALLQGFLCISSNAQELLSAGSCDFNGELHSDKDVWKSEPCQVCVCDSGNILCDEVFCDFVSDCPHPIILEGECCPICPTEENEEDYRKETSVIPRRAPPAVHAQVGKTTITLS
uniref:collagen alpha-1(II) chain-like n=1 Tax=Myxine glutinosa TaxID=7769 RepID=UPI00358FF62E